MQTVLLVVQSLGLVAGGLLGAAIVCWVFWQGFRIVRHPEWAATVMLLCAVLGAIGLLPHSLLLDFILTFLAIASIPVWIEGRAWRKASREVDRVDPALQKSGSTMADPPSELELAPYPAIRNCVSGGQQLSREDLRLVATRMWREAFQVRADQVTAREPSFATRRALLRSATAALSGSQSPLPILRPSHQHSLGPPTPG